MTSLPGDILNPRTQKESDGATGESRAFSPEVTIYDDAPVVSYRVGFVSYVPRLPTDIVECVMSYFSVNPDTENVRSVSNRFHSDLRNFCLVRREWVTPARRSLYRVVHWDHGKHGKLMGTFQNTPILRSLVKLVLVDIWTSEWVLLVGILPSASVLAEGLLSSRGRTEVRQTVSTLATISKHISRLELADNYSADISSAILDPNRWSQLEELSIYCFDGLFSPGWHSPPRTEVCFPQLTSLTLGYCEDVSLPANFVCKLQKLKLFECELVNQDQFVDFIHRHSNSLDHIVIENSHFTRPQNGSSANMLFATVATLACNAREVRFGSVEDYEWKSVLDYLPSTITRVSLSDIKDQILPDECQKLLDTRRYLKRFELTGVGIRRQRQWKATVEAAERVGIEFVVVDKPAKELRM
jgi:hypothetical protein